VVSEENLEKLKLRKIGGVRRFLFASSDTVGKESPNRNRVVTAFSMERLWGFRDWQSDGDMFVDLDNQGEHGYIGDQVRQSQRHVSDVIKCLFTTP